MSKSIEQRREGNGPSGVADGAASVASTADGDGPVEHAATSPSTAMATSRRHRSRFARHTRPAAGGRPSRPASVSTVRCALPWSDSRRCPPLPRERPRRPTHLRGSPPPMDTGSPLDPRDAQEQGGTSGSPRGIVPGVVYEQASTNVQVDAKTFETLYRAAGPDLSRGSVFRISSSTSRFIKARPAPSPRGQPSMSTTSSSTSTSRWRSTSPDRPTGEAPAVEETGGTPLKPVGERPGEGAADRHPARDRRRRQRPTAPRRRSSRDLNLNHDLVGHLPLCDSCPGRRCASSRVLYDEELEAAAEAARGRGGRRRRRWRGTGEEAEAQSNRGASARGPSRRGALPTTHSPTDRDHRLPLRIASLRDQA